MPASITSSGVTETYAYDADGERVTRTVGSATTLGALVEQTGGVVKRYSSFNGANVAVRSSAGVSYLHGDHLSSVGAIITGTVVLAYDEATNTTAVYAVTLTIHRSGNRAAEGERRDAGNDPKHSFFTRERGWVAALELRLGEHVPRLHGLDGMVQVRSPPAKCNCESSLVFRFW